MKQKTLVSKIGLTLLGIIIIPTLLNAQKVSYNAEKNGKDIFLKMANSEIELTILLNEETILQTTIKGKNDWLGKYHTSNKGITFSQDFDVNMVWTDWWAPGKKNNADVELTLNKADFKFITYKFTENKDGSCQLDLVFLKNNSLNIKYSYLLKPGDFYLRHKLTLRDTLYKKHFLDKITYKFSNISPLSNGSALAKFDYGADEFFATETRGSKNILNSAKIIKEGDFGQPVAIEYENSGVFMGIEYPIATNKIFIDNNHGLNGNFYEYIGQVVKDKWTGGEWLVIALTPEEYVQKWFYTYLDDIRVAPVKPYTLYNSWYDLRSPEYPGVEPKYYMNPENINRIIKLFKENMIDKYGIQLDAFVLDDGWDIYDSDWKMRKGQFPDGLMPITNKLNEMGTDLGIWFGPTGGYSFRMRRINWMAEHGYETVGEEVSYNQAHLCIGGKNYSKLFQKRVVDMVEKEGVAYFKWDGLQFSCSEPDHGHPIGIHSRKYIFDSFTNTCKLVREKNNNVFLNITSGTWLSPWWLKYANIIWMDAADYGFADVPSISKRDAAMTYRDLALYDDFHKKSLWFPISNLMTHGIIKGKLQRLGGEDEPINKFTDNALLYFARGVSMYELYISPDILTDKEWEAIAKSLQWAKDRFDILKSTFMIGGDPTVGETYGYAHYNGNNGIVALRNPVINQKLINIKLDPAHGLDKDAKNLVLERVYPDRWISPDLYAAGVEIEIPLDGFETAIYEIYPLNEAKKPLIAGVSFDIHHKTNNELEYVLYQQNSAIKILNPDMINTISQNNKLLDKCDIHGQLKNIQEHTAHNELVNFKVNKSKKETSIDFNFKENNDISNTQLAILLHPSEDSREIEFPQIKIYLNNKEHSSTIEKQKGVWMWSSAVSTELIKNGRMVISSNNKNEKWSGKAELYLIYREKKEAVKMTITTTSGINKEILPPRPFKTDEKNYITRVGDFNID